MTQEEHDKMHELGIDSSYSVLDDTDGMAYARSLTGITEEMILEEIAGYKDPEIEDFIKANIK